MKTLLTSVALVATIATGVSANIVANPTHTNSPNNQWVGIETSTVLPDMCNFVSNVSGHMDLDTDTGTWTATTPSKITVEYRNVASITVSPDNRKGYQKNFSYGTNGALVENTNTGNGVIHGHAAGTRHGETFDADVDYAGSTYKDTQDGGTLATIWKTVNAGDSFTFNSAYGDDFAGIAELEIRGTAKPTGVAIYTADEEYYVPHLVTCVQ